MSISMYMMYYDTRYVYTFRKYVELLRNHRVTPVIVFDGRSAPAKEPTRAKRHKYAVLHRY